MIENTTINTGDKGVLVDVPQIDLGALLKWIFDILASVIPVVFDFLKSAQGIITGLSIPVSLIFIIGIIYSVERLKRIRKIEDEMLNPNVEPSFDEVTSPIGGPNGDGQLAKKWQTVMEHVDSENPNDWRQAIMEADIILDDILTKMGYQGMGIGEKLKRVERADFVTLDQAWEAHKVRNAIAHEGSEYPLNKYEARRVINMYRQVFEEFFYI